MLANIGLYSYGAAFIIYALLGSQVFLSRRNRPLAIPLLLASILTAVWAVMIAGSTLLSHPQVKLIQLTELARNAGWIFLLLRLIELRMQGTDHILGTPRWIPWFGIGVAIALAALFMTPWLVSTLSLPDQLEASAAFTTWLASAIIGLLLLEQIFRNGNEALRWSSKHLCLGLGILFAYDFFMYAEALLFNQLDRNLWLARGIVVSMTAIFVAIGYGRIARPDAPRNVNVSRHVVFHTITLLAAGFYLIAMALAGYFIRYLGGSWGGVLQITFLCASGLLLVVLLFSGQIRARTRVWLSKNFFSYKYDYRTEWLQFTQTLEESDKNTPDNITRAIARLAQSPAGILWSRNEEGRFNFTVNWEMTPPAVDSTLGTLPTWLQAHEWVIDLREWRQEPDLYENLELPQFIADTPRAWLIIPLMFGTRLQGILMLQASEFQTELNWEDRDLLKVAGRQAASHLAQYQAHQALVESRQFEAFNRLSAYVVHDLKNILAQQSLIVSNAEKHRDNPAFIDDMIDTVRNSVERMTRLMEQMRSGARDRGIRLVSLCALLNEAVDQRRLGDPAPSLTQCDDDLLVKADSEHLTTVFTHLIQNAQEATTKKGQVNVRLIRENHHALVEIEDDGSGMDEDFIQNRLFKPFDSTKGLTGMGIGAFESREFIRDLGGDIRVTSTPGEGSLFRIVLPCTLATDEPTMNDRAIIEGTNG